MLRYDTGGQLDWKTEPELHRADFAADADDAVGGVVSASRIDGEHVLADCNGLVKDDFEDGLR